MDNRSLVLALIAGCLIGLLVIGLVLILKPIILGIPKKVSRKFSILLGSGVILLTLLALVMLMSLTVR